ncbi:MAG: HAMP domain-containing protein, partial [Synergistaceae bacterium]|nr:HAMP domain-containing protein [Synergistaceae bacterium]
MRNSGGRKYWLKTKLSLHIAFVALIMVALISVLANIFIRKQFEGYVARQQERRTEEITANVGAQYDAVSGSWDLDFLHAIGMYALYEGYIVSVYDANGETLWDARVCDMEACAMIMDDVAREMRERYPGTEGEFAVMDVPIEQNGREIGLARIEYFSPYFFSDDDFMFIGALNTILLGSGVFALALAAAVGWILARNVSDPIRKAVDAAKRMSSGDYAAMIEDNSNIRELDELTKSVNSLARSITTQESLRKQLTADVAHELRTPLATIGTHIEAMIDGVWEPTRERLASCYEEIERIGRLVRDMENLARVESETLKLDKTPVDLREIAELTIRNFEADIRAKGVDARVDGEISEIEADRDRISQVFINLISNAVKYTNDGGSITVTLSETDETAIAGVADNGEGISEDDLPFIFERFYRADKSRNRTTGGSGIGLAVVRSIVSSHGGTVEVESAPGKGSVFRVKLPK